MNSLWMKLRRLSIYLSIHYYSSCRRPSFPPQACPEQAPCSFLHPLNGLPSSLQGLVSILWWSAVIFVLWVRVRYGRKAFFVLRAFIDPSVTGWICVVFACSQRVHFILLNPDFFFSHDLLELAAKIGHTTRAWVPSWGLFLATSFLYISNNRFCSHIDIQSSNGWTHPFLFPVYV